VSDKKIINTALLIAASGFAVNHYQAHKLRTSDKGYLETEDQQMKMLGTGVAILATASAGIVHLTRNNPRARKLAFGGLAAGTIGYFLIIIAALKKMS